VSLDEAPHLRVVGNLDGGDAHIGMAVVPYWAKRTGEDGGTVLLPQWRPADAGWPSVGDLGALSPRSETVRAQKPRPVRLR
jgi:hypothetical protein